MRKTEYSAIGLLAVFLGGVVAWGGFNTVLEATNTQAFCISCHEMKEYVFQEYRQSLHYRNRSGVRASCPDCHVPKDWWHMLVRKVGATNELYHKLAGSIDSRRKFTARRLELAQKVWRDMKSTDSRECRNCHAYEAMQARLQGDSGRQQHARAKREAETCIDCHKGIAHHLPEIFVEQEHERYQREGIPCIRCHTGIAHPAEDQRWTP